MDKYSNLDVFIVFIAFALIMTMGALLAEVAVWVAKRLGFEFEDQEYVNTDFYQRLQDGEELTAQNMFNNE